MMRLTQAQIDQIKASVRQVFGEQATVCLFGSRADDAALGGDVDLLISTTLPIDNPTILAAKLAAKVMRFQHGRNVDVVVKAPNLSAQPIFDIAEKTGVLL